MKIVLAGIVESLNTRVDGSVKVVFSTQELDPSKGGELFQLRGKYCKCLLSDNNISNVEEEVLDKAQMAKTGKQKTPSQRLRSVLYILWQQSGVSIPFDDFYKTEVDGIIESIKSKLD